MVEHSSALTLPQAARWRGTNGYTLLSYEIDFSDGGASRLYLRSPEGLEHWVEDVDLEIVEPERIVFSGRLEMEGQRLPGSQATVTFRRT